MPLIYRIVLYGCLAVIVALVIHRWRPGGRRARLGRARLVNELLWTAIPLLILLFLLWR